MTYSLDGGNTARPVYGGCASASYVVLGMIENNTYLVDDGTGGVIVVDPCTKPDTIMAVVGERRISALFVTHNHFDHVGALNDLRLASKAPVYASCIDAVGIENPKPGSHGIGFDACPIDQQLEDGDVIRIGDIQWQAMLTPGHTKGGMCFYLASEQGTNPSGQPMLLSGDTLFHASIGRTDFDGGSLDDMRLSLRKLEKLPGGTIVMPGHGMLTTIDAERERVFDAYR